VQIRGASEDEGVTYYDIAVLPSVSSGKAPYIVSRRYNAFHDLRNQLGAYSMVAPFPAKTWFRPTDPEAIEARRTQLEQFLRHCTALALPGGPRREWVPVLHEFLDFAFAPYGGPASAPAPAPASAPAQWDHGHQWSAGYNPAVAPPMQTTPPAAPAAPDHLGPAPFAAPDQVAEPVSAPFLVRLAIPPNTAPGTLLEFENPRTGQRMYVEVPQGVGAEMDVQLI
jgi:hypothetical protein